MKTTTAVRRTSDAVIIAVTYHEASVTTYECCLPPNLSNRQADLIAYLLEGKDPLSAYHAKAEKLAKDLENRANSFAWAAEKLHGLNKNSLMPRGSANLDIVRLEAYATALEDASGEIVRSLTDHVPF